MWGLLVRLRRFLRPLPTIGHVFLLRKIYRPGGSDGISFENYSARSPTGMERDLIVPLPDYAAALDEAKAIIAGSLPEGTEITDVRPADRHDIPESTTRSILGPVRHFGFNINTKNHV